MNFYASQTRSIVFFGLTIPPVWFIPYDTSQGVFAKVKSNSPSSLFRMSLNDFSFIFFWNWPVTNFVNSSIWNFYLGTVSTFGHPRFLLHPNWKSEKLRSNLSAELWLNLAWRLTYFKNLWTNLYLCSSLIKWK